MNVMNRLFFMATLCLLASCAIKSPIKNQYKLSLFERASKQAQSSPYSILVAQPSAVSGYQTEQMLYIVKPFELKPFSRNAWVGPPANMLFPLILQSLQSSDYFSAVVSSPYSDKADYRLETELIELEQNFLMNPSMLQFVVKVVLSHISDNRVLASKIITEQICCPTNTPYGGVIAANQATQSFTKTLIDFVIHQIQKDNQLRKPIAKNTK